MDSTDHSGSEDGSMGSPRDYAHEGTSSSDNSNNTAELMAAAAAPAPDDDHDDDDDDDGSASSGGSAAAAEAPDAEPQAVAVVAPPDADDVAARRARHRQVAQMVRRGFQEGVQLAPAFGSQRGVRGAAPVQPAAMTRESFNAQMTGAISNMVGKLQGPRIAKLRQHAEAIEAVSSSITRLTQMRAYPEMVQAALEAAQRLRQQVDVDDDALWRSVVDWPFESETHLAQRLAALQAAQASITTATSAVTAVGTPDTDAPAVAAVARLADTVQLINALMDTVLSTSWSVAPIQVDLPAMQTQARAACAWLFQRAMIQLRVQVDSLRSASKYAIPAKMTAITGQARSLRLLHGRTVFDTGVPARQLQWLANVVRCPNVDALLEFHNSFEQLEAAPSIEPGHARRDSGGAAGGSGAVTSPVTAPAVDGAIVRAQTQHLALLTSAIKANTTKELDQALETIGTPDKLAAIINKPSSTGDTPIHIAAAANANHAVNWLLAHGADPAVSNASSNTVLHLAAPGKHGLHICTKIVQALASDTVAAFINLQNAVGDTAAHCAARNGKWDVVTELVRLGAVPTLKNSRGHSMLQYIASQIDVPGTERSESTDVATSALTDVALWAQGAEESAAPSRVLPFESYYLQSALSDVTLVSADGDRIPAHRIIVCVHSQVIRAMLDGDFTEGVSREVTWSGISTRVMKQVLRYCYTGRCTIPIGDVQLAVDTLQAAREYMMPGLFTAVQAFLIRNITTGNAVPMFQWALELDARLLTPVAARFVLASFDTVEGADTACLLQILNFIQQRKAQASK